MDQEAAGGAGGLEAKIQMRNDSNQKPFDLLVVILMHCEVGSMKENALDHCPSYPIFGGVGHSQAEAAVDVSSFPNVDAFLRPVVEVVGKGRVHPNSQSYH